MRNISIYSGTSPPTPPNGPLAVSLMEMSVGLFRDTRRGTCVIYHLTSFALPLGISFGLPILGSWPLLSNSSWTFFPTVTPARLNFTDRGFFLHYYHSDPNFVNFQTVRHFYFVFPRYWNWTCGIQPLATTFREKISSIQDELKKCFYFTSRDFAVIVFC